MDDMWKNVVDLQQVDSHIYTAAWLQDYAMGPAVHGGSMAAIIQATASLHLSTTLASFNQPDIHTLHVEFLRPGTHHQFTIKVTDLKTGKGTNFLQLYLSQNDSIKAAAMVTSTNFSIPLGPTAQSDVRPNPPPNPLPDFQKAEAHQPDPNWLPIESSGNLFRLGSRLVYLYPAEGFTTDGIVDIWISFKESVRVAMPHLTLLCDLQPSMSDTLLRNDQIFDAHKIWQLSADWAKNHPGASADAKFSLKDAVKSKIWNSTLTLDIEFKQRLQKVGLRWVNTRAEVKMLKDGRMDLDLTLRDEDMNILCLARQVMVVLEANRRFGEKKKGKL